MSIAKKAVVWGLFAAGGTLSAFLFPALIGLFLLVAIGAVPPGLEFDRIYAFASHWVGKSVLFLVISLSLWHAARVPRFRGEKGQGSCQRRLPGCRCRHRIDGFLFVSNLIQDEAKTRTT
jgi:hypothetical protein